MKAFTKKVHFFLLASIVISKISQGMSEITKTINFSMSITGSELTERLKTSLSPDTISHPGVVNPYNNESMNKTIKLIKFVILVRLNELIKNIAVMSASKNNYMA